MVAGPGTVTADAPRSTPSTIAAATRPRGASTRGATDAQISKRPPAAHVTGMNDVYGGEDANATPQPSANPPHMKEAQRPVREPARRLIAGAAPP